MTLTRNILLIVLSLFAILLIAFRVYASGAMSYIFLLWNLFLVVIPFAISNFLSSNPKLPSPVFYSVSAIWLLFFPNAPYVLTDLLHLRPFMVPEWYDLLMVLSFAWVSLMLGFVSLSEMQTLVTQKFNQLIGWLFVSAAIILASFGIYLGRFLRWNSWDVLTQPAGLMKDILDRVVNPLSHIHTYGFTLLLAVFLLLAYLSVQFFQIQKTK